MHAHNCKQIRNPHIHQKIKLILGWSFGLPYTFIPYIHVYEYISIYSIQTHTFQNKDTHAHTHIHLYIYTLFRTEILANINRSN